MEMLLSWVLLFLGIAVMLYRDYRRGQSECTAPGVCGKVGNTGFKADGEELLESWVYRCGNCEKRLNENEGW